MRHSHGIDPDTGHDYDADAFDDMSYNLTEDVDFCAEFAANHACELASIAAGVASLECRARVISAWDEAVRSHMEDQVDV